MVRVASKYKSEPLKDILSVSSRLDKLGNIFYLVEWHCPSLLPSDYNFRFEKMESVLDFIYSNFK